jgi:hypothetical protein
MSGAWIESWFFRLVSTTSPIRRINSASGTSGEVFPDFTPFADQIVDYGEASDVTDDALHEVLRHRLIPTRVHLQQRADYLKAVFDAVMYLENFLDELLVT